MTPRFRTSVLVGLLAAVLVACGATTPTVPPATAASSGTPAILPTPINSGYRVGDNRMVFVLTDSTGQKEVSTPDRTLSVAYKGPNGETVEAQPYTFIWAIEGTRGVYVNHATFDAAGKWTADFTTQAPGSGAVTVTFGFDVQQRLQTISPGDPAPSIATPTLADVGGDVSRISTDTKPEKRFYETSEADALAAKRPFVLIFATPKFCQTAVCGPTLDKLKPVAAAHPEMTFINVEPYELSYENGGLQAKLDAQGQLIPAAPTNAFKLVSEPIVFVVGADGVVQSSFELVFSPDEIDAAIAAVEGAGPPAPSAAASGSATP